ncbi:MAG: WD40/YVTN/BNR-like repeat-containing protein [Candidatus Acidiferrales bacterium]
MKRTHRSAEKFVRPGMLLFTLILFSGLLPQAASAQQHDAGFFSGMRWRELGPFRGGRANAVTGVPGEPNHFYFGSVGGGVWESFNSGETWTPIFDHQSIASIGAIAVAPSNPKIIYVGSGEADMRSQISYGNGVYKSTDGGKTWSHLGLDDTRQIGRALVDPRNPDVVFVAALGHAYGPSPDRGVFRSTDGGATWQKVLYQDENTGAIDLAFDPQNPQTIYAALWATRRPPWSIYPPANLPGGGLFKSTDGGATWQPLTNGLPTEGLGRIGVAVAPSDPHRVYAIVDARKGGLFRSDDSGATWSLLDADPRIWGRGWYFCNVVVDPQDSGTLYISNTSVYRSTDAGKSFTAIKGAPGGDDYHQLWIYPADGQRMILSSDQGVVVSVDGAKSWSSWYNQPTAQIYHVVADNQFPYWVYGAQQDSGAVKVASRSIHGEISFRDWAPACAGGESGYIAVDPKESNALFGDDVSRCDQSINVGRSISPNLGHADLGPFRRTWTLPVVFSPADHALYFSDQYLWKTINGGQSWERISSDLSREDPGVPPNLDPTTAADAPNGKRRGVIYTVAPSPVAAATLWAGTDDGLIHLTRDGGKTWKDVTPSALTPWSKVSMIEASRSDAAVAFASVDRHRLEDYKPYIYRTADSGKTWNLISAGIPDGSYVNSVREDPSREGLLFAGTELGAYVSFDSGDDWQPLQLNLPTASVRDFAIHGDDLIAATHGRGFWVLDDITPLRQIAAARAASGAFLFVPQEAIRMRIAGFDGTPLPFGSAVASNPPTGAILDYYLASPASGAVTLEILDAAGKSVHKYSSEDRPPHVDPNKLNIPAYWIRPGATLSTEAGMHRWVWDLRYASTGEGRGSAMAAMFGFGGGNWALPGHYTVKLTASGKTYSQPLVVKMDPRVKVPLLDLQRQFQLAQQITARQAQVNSARGEISRVHQQIVSLKKTAAGLPAGMENSELLSALDSLDRGAEAIGGPQDTSEFAGFGFGEDSADTSSLRFLGGELSQILSAVEGADAAPSETAVAAFAQSQNVISAALEKWSALKSKDLSRANSLLKSANLPPISLSPLEKTTHEP